MIKWLVERGVLCSGGGLTKDGLAHEPVDGEEEVLDVLIH